MGRAQGIPITPTPPCTSLSSLPGDVLGLIFAHLDPESRSALFYASHAVRRAPQVLEQLTRRVMLSPAVMREHPLESFPRERALQRLLVAGKLVKDDVHHLLHFLRPVIGSRAWHLLQGLRELRIESVWQTSHAHVITSEQWRTCCHLPKLHTLRLLGSSRFPLMQAPSPGLLLNSKKSTFPYKHNFLLTHPQSVWQTSHAHVITSEQWRTCCHLPKLRTLRLLGSSCPALVQALAETQTDRQLTELTLDTSQPYSGPERLLLQYVQPLSQLSSVQVLQIKCHPDHLKAVSIAQLGDMSSLRHLVCATRQMPQGLDNIVRLCPQLHSLELPRLSHSGNTFLNQHTSPLTSILCNELDLADLPALYEGLPMLKTVHICCTFFLPRATTLEDACGIARRIHASPRRSQVLLVLGGTRGCQLTKMSTSLSTNKAPAADNDMPPFTLNCNAVECMATAILPLIGSPSLTRLTELRLQEPDLSNSEDIARVATLFPNLKHLHLSSTRSSSKAPDTSQYCAWHTAVLRLHSLRRLETDMPRDVEVRPSVASSSRVHWAHQVRALKEAVIATCMAAQERGLRFTFALHVPEPFQGPTKFGKEVEESWRRHFGGMLGRTVEFELCAEDA